MIKKGIIMEHDGENAVLFTESGEFIKFKSKEKLSVGQEYCYKAKSKILPKQLLLAASILLIVFSGIFYNMYYTVYASVTVSINPELKIDINRFNRIIGITPLNDDAKNLLSDTKIKHKTLDNGLILIIDKAKEKKYITEEYYNGKPKTIKLSVEGKKVNLTRLYNKIKNQKLNFETSDLKQVEKKYEKADDKKNKDKENKENNKTEKINDKIKINNENKVKENIKNDEPVKNDKVKGKPKPVGIKINIKKNKK